VAEMGWFIPEMGIKHPISASRTCTVRMGGLGLCHKSKAMSKKVFRVSDESLNSYGYWVLTAGIDLTEFLVNPIMFYNHDRSRLPIGTWENVHVKDNQLFATPKFATHQFAKDIEAMVEDGTIKTASIGAVPLGLSDASDLIKQGQIRPTLVKSLLKELSVTDISSNKNAVALYDAEMHLITLNDGVDCPLPLLTLTDTSLSNNNNLDMKGILVKLGLPDTATEADGIVKLQDIQAENVSLKAQLTAMNAEKTLARKGEIKTLLDAAVTDNRIQEIDRANFEQLFDQNFDAAKAVLSNIKPQVKLSEVVIPDGGAGLTELKWNGEAWKALDKGGKLEQLKAQNFDLFKQMYKAEFGREYKA
jgi:hypothetical protein